MFSKAKSKDKQPKRSEANTADIRDVSQDTGTKRSASGKPAPRARSGRGGGVPSLISGDMIIKGAIESDGEVQFDGEIDGDIRAKGLVIGEGAKVSGEVIAEKVRVSGTVEGTIRGVDVELASGALVKGDITHTSLSIESGARFDGNCRHSDDPVGDPRAGAPSKPNLPRPGPAVKPTSTDASAQEAPAPTPAPLMAEVDEAGDAVEAPAELKRELMPQRQDAAADRVFLQNPAATNLR